MRALVSIHRWLGVAFCLFFAMWFATGIVMHFVPFPALTEAERLAGLLPLDPAALRAAPRAAAVAATLPDAVRVRLIARHDGPVFVVEHAAGITAVRAADLAPAAVRTGNLAVTLAAAHARQRGMPANAIRFMELADYDQWTVSNGLDAHRPLYRLALGDPAGTEFYVSSATGEIVRDTTAHQRGWNYAGSVLHWVYPTVLRSHWRVWDATVWTLSLGATIAAISGGVVGLLRLRIVRRRVASPFRGWQAWHHWLGLGCLVFVLTWIFSGWLSMDHSRLFSNGQLTASETAAFADSSVWKKDLPAAPPFAAGQTREIEWFAFAGRIYRRERLTLESQQLAVVGENARPGGMFLEAADIARVAHRLGSNCAPAIRVTPGDHYPAASTLPDAPVYRIVCGSVWFQVDGANGAPLEKLDGSRRAYRWLYQALHTLDFPALSARPRLRTAAIVLLCGLGTLFSVTAVVIGWRRLRNRRASL